MTGDFIKKLTEGFWLYQPNMLLHVEGSRILQTHPKAMTTGWEWESLTENTSCKDGHKKSTEKEDIKKRWQEHTEELYKKDLNDLDNYNGLTTHLEPDILEGEVKWALRSITMNKASGGDGISAELFRMFKDDSVKVLHSICQQIWKTQQWLQDWKRSLFTPIPKKRNVNECSNYCTIAPLSHASKVMFKILQATLQQ